MRTSLCLVLAAAVAGCGKPSTGTAPAALTGSNDDAETPEANVVVQLTGNGFLCTGTLITPGIVLTANHCITGDDTGKAGMGFKPTVNIGASRSDFVGGNVVSAGNTLVMLNQPIDEDHGGMDIALVFLSTPVLEQAKIERPSLVADAPCCKDSDVNGGTYIGPIGLAGWSPIGADGKTVDPTDFQFRQSNLFNSIDLDHLPEEPDGDVTGQTWRHDRHGIDLRPGDSGGPLFKQRPDGTRDIWGVANGIWWDLESNIFSGYDRWSDVTRGVNKQFILARVVDHAHDAQPRWMAMHPAMQAVPPGGNDKWIPRSDGTPRWIGEADYTGACQIAFDRDCDHWYDEHDNCPSIKNSDQADSDDDGIGDVCPLPPPAAPSGCVFWANCGGAASVHCDSDNADVLILKRDVDGQGHYQAVDTKPADNAQHVVYLSDGEIPASAATATFIVCAQSRWGTTCTSPPSTVTLDHSSCGVDNTPIEAKPAYVTLPAGSTVYAEVDTHGWATLSGVSFSLGALPAGVTATTQTISHEPQGANPWLFIAFQTSTNAPPAQVPLVVTATDNGQAYSVTLTLDVAPCMPASCSALGATCGAHPDGCGVSIYCGDCASGSTCDGTQCIRDNCVPNTCASAGAACGTIPDGCGRTLDCGSYAGGNVCKSNQCVACVPTTCAAVGALCGSIPDGCGGTLTCGTCGTGKHCSLNQCCPGTTVWDPDSGMCVKPGTGGGGGGGGGGCGTKLCQ